MNKKIIFPLAVIFALMFGACGVNVNIDVQRGSGNVVSETRDVSNFDKVVLTGIGDVTVVQGDHESLVIEAEDNLIRYIETEVENGVLTIGFERKSLLPTEPVKFHLTMREVRGLDTRGVSNIQSDEITTDRLDIGISGTGSVTINDLTADLAVVNVSGAGSFNAEGQVDSQRVTLSGAGNFEGEDLESQTAEVIISGLGRVAVWATDTLDVTISGTGSVDYYGSPEVNQRVSGVGRLKDMGDK